MMENMIEQMMETMTDRLVCLACMFFCLVVKKFASAFFIFFRVHFERRLDTFHLILTPALIFHFKLNWQLATNN